ncbi:hypothetical protein CH305_18280 [Rhodococcus sp. 15-649-2-2]|uniref:hypothetical protein n=1 Tax=Rhodococcus sp. 15-649-2-2 TaxID=2023140 RepID=UPI000B9B35C1|nr:hypothetical protein [Rhodococcus sp. 15-649-2-2]OZE77185.1 hypothetical protein CH305_18280 [Rhodococcus sp. 15-649-2-2]
MTGPLVVKLPYLRPPLSLNDSGASQGAMFAKARTIKEVRQTVAWLAKAAKLPIGVPHAVVEVHYRPATRGRHDADNVVLSSKAIFDGLVDGGLVPDDIPELMSKPEVVLHKSGNPGMWLEITVLDSPRELPE